MDISFDWAEWIAVFFLLIGSLMALFVANVVILYLVCFLMGLAFGRMWYKWKKRGRVPLFLSIMTFIFGFLMGAVFRSARVLLIIFVAGMFAGYYISEKELLRAVR
ncbi:hypothetical protein HY489_00165 [Candidatus Woesearchaeota archaeon]|nr:hypothetical protein [Candidatus Woesearchaeota archaeon]